MKADMVIRQDEESNLHRPLFLARCPQELLGLFASQLKPTRAVTFIRLVHMDFFWGGFGLSSMSTAD